MESSDWPSMSIKPGATTFPAASMVRARDAAARLPMAAILPSLMPTSAEYQGEPVPSMRWKGRGDCACEAQDARNSAKARRDFRFRSFIRFLFVSNLVEPSLCDGKQLLRGESRLRELAIRMR